MCNFFELYVYLFKNHLIGLIYPDAESRSRMLRKVEEMEEILGTQNQLLEEHLGRTEGIGP